MTTELHIPLDRDPSQTRLVRVCDSGRALVLTAAVAAVDRVSIEAVEHMRDGDDGFALRAREGEWVLAERYAMLTTEAALAALHDPPEAVREVAKRLAQCADRVAFRVAAQSPADDREEALGLLRALMNDLDALDRGFVAPETFAEIARCALAEPTAPQVREAVRAYVAALARRPRWRDAAPNPWAIALASLSPVSSRR
ncbi:hypothetical protein [Microbacterium sp. P05]|uniref:hypothetical protein n=1 Tax=Microbacterium sp. P05 TaxID=3366948 RepID=UPI003745DE60